MAQKTRNKEDTGVTPPSSSGTRRMEGWGIRDKGNLGVLAFEFSLGLPRWLRQ